MTSIKVMETYWELKALYIKAARHKSVRGLFGYMMNTGRPDNTVFGGAVSLLLDIDSLPPSEVYQLERDEDLSDEKAYEIVTAAEIARAGGFDQFAPTGRQLRRIAKALKNMDGMEV